MLNREPEKDDQKIILILIMFFVVRMKDIED